MTVEKTTSFGHIRSGSTEDFEIRTGLRQGDPLSTLLFNLALERITRDSQLKRGGHIFYKSHRVICYADDLAITGRREKELEEIAKNLVEATSV